MLKQSSEDRHGHSLDLNHVCVARFTFIMLAVLHMAAASPVTEDIESLQVTWLCTLLVKIRN